MLHLYHLGLLENVLNHDCFFWYIYNRFNLIRNMLPTVVGWFYVFLGTLGITANILVTFLFLSDRIMRRNVTYIFMINLAIADATVLSSNAFYAGVHCLVNINNETVDRIMAWIIAVGWYPGCLFFSIIAFTRWVALARPDKKLTYFTKKKLSMCIIVPWVVCSLFYLCFIFYPKTLFVWFPSYFTWGFDEESSYLGFYLQKQNTSTNILFALIEFYFNVKTLIYIRNTQKLIRNLCETTIRRREVKLFAQCFVTGCIFISAAIMYAVFYAIRKYAKPEHFLMMHIFWVMHHLINPFIYFSMNKRLREVFYRKICLKLYLLYNRKTNVTVIVKNKNENAKNMKNLNKF